MITVSKGTNNEDIFHMNRILILQHLQRHGICTRAHLSKTMGLTQASISKTVSHLIESGIVVETGSVSGEKGRRSVGIRLSGALGKVIGVRLSRRNFSVGVFDMGGTLYDAVSEAFGEENSPRQVLDRIKENVTGFIERFRDVAAIGIAVPGPYRLSDGRILLVTGMQSWENIDLKEAFAGSFGCPVVIRHDANSGALADWWFGAKVRSSGTLIHFLVGEGVGAGIVMGGTLLSGDQGAAGEVGHISIDVNGPRCACGNYGCLEMYCSSLAFVKHAQEQVISHTESILQKYGVLTASGIFTAAAQGDSFAVALVRRAARYIGYGVVNLINAYDPSTVIISNEMAQGGELLLKEIHETVRERVLPGILSNVQIELTGFKNDAILYGAAASAIDYCLKRPTVLAGRMEERQNTAYGI